MPEFDHTVARGPARVTATVMSTVAGAVDQLFRLAVIDRPRSKRPGRRPNPAARIAALQQIHAELAEDAVLSDTATLFPAPAPCAPELVPVRSRAGIEMVDMRFPSPHQLHLQQVSERYRGYRENHTAVARWFRPLGTDGERPVLLLLHGYMGGQFAVEERVWPLRWLMDWGLDPVLVALPFHGLRARPGRRVPPFPAKDPRFTIEGFRQAVADLRALAGFFRARGAPAVGTLGMSLGGYTSALLATVEPLAFTVPFAPLASLGDFLLAGGSLVGTAGQSRAQHDLIERIYAVISPLYRKPVCAPGGRLVVAGRADRITPLDHAARLAAHFEAPLEVFHGGHLLQLGRSQAFRALERRLRANGVLDAAPGR